jgi:heavy metal sensor kinase
VLRSIRFRLTLWYIVLLAAILAAFSAGIYLTLRNNLYVNLDDSLETRTEDLLPRFAFEDSTLVILGEAADEGEEFVRVYDVSGEVDYEEGLRAASAPVDGDAVAKSLAGRTITRTADVDGETFRSLFTPLVREGRTDGVIEVARSEGDVTEILNTLLIILGLSYPATLVLASFGGIFLAGRALAPIDKLTRVARRISAEDMSERLDLSLPDDEVGRLARTFDEMLARLDHAFRQQRQFTADASHELRTPLTAIKGQVEVALTKGRSVDAYQDVLRSVNDEADRLIRLVGSLLTLARADAGQIALAREPVDLGELIASAVEQVRLLAQERGLALTVTAGPSVTLQADQDLLLQLLLNLLDNAIKYTPSGGRVSIGWRADGGNVELRVSDSGPGIAREDLSRVFDRFYRADKARSRAEGGSGLGLSISKWIVEAHGGTITVESTPGQGATFTVTLPR